MDRLFKPKMVFRLECINGNWELLWDLISKIKQEYGSTNTLVFDIVIKF